MAKFYGVVGYVETRQTSPGVWEPVTTEKKYYGDVVRSNRRLDSNDRINDDVVVTNKISIVSDAEANQNFHAIRYVTWMGARWKVTDVEVQSPRLILTLGGVYNGE